MTIFIEEGGEATYPTRCGILNKVKESISRLQVNRIKSVERYMRTFIHEQSYSNKVERLLLFNI